MSLKWFCANRKTAGICRNNTEEETVVAMTLAVALRQALVGVLGISATRTQLFNVRSDWRMGNQY